MLPFPLVLATFLHSIYSSSPLALAYITNALPNLTAPLHDHDDVFDTACCYYLFYTYIYIYINVFALLFIS